MISEVKNNVLNDLAKLINVNSDVILKANQQDLASCSQKDVALFDRLKIDEHKIKGMQLSVLKVKQMPDPEGELLYSYEKEPGLQIENRVVPFGTILIIYESRPDVTIEAAITAFKAGNKILLKGGKEAKLTNLVLSDLWQQALLKNGQDKNFVRYLDYDRNQTQDLIKKQSIKIDVIIPRGGEQLINSIRNNTNIPLIISGRGNNFMYIDADADFQMAIAIVLDGKTRISVCNALDKIYIHKSHTKENINLLIQALQTNNIEIVADEILSQLDESITPIKNNDIFYQEFLAAKILLAQVDNINTAIVGINQYSGGHSATIISSNAKNAQHFQSQVDCAAVYHNASTRYTDGGEFGLGAEIAISTQKLHFRGPVGLNELVTNKWFISGTGNTRG